MRGASGEGTDFSALKSVPYIPVLLKGGSRIFKKDGREILLKGKPEEWAVSLNGQILGEPHPTMGDRASADLYVRLLHEEQVSPPRSWTPGTS